MPLKSLIDQATALPWRVREHPSMGTWVDAPEAKIENPNGPDYPRQILEDEDYEEKDSDARLICLAVNNLSAMVEVLQFYAETKNWELHKFQDGPLRQEQITYQGDALFDMGAKARAILAKLDKEAGQ